MRGFKILFIFLLVNLSCADEQADTKCCKSCFTMTISDALPVQFWLNGQQSFNQKEVCSIYDVCFCQPFNADDELTIQFDDSDYDNYQLKIVDAGLNTIATLDFTEISNNKFQVSFVFSEVGIIDEKIQISIISVLQIKNSNVQHGFYPWLSIGAASSLEWTFSNPGASVSFTSVNTSKLLAQPFSPVVQNQPYAFNYDVTVSSYVSGTLQIWIAFSDESGTVLYEETSPRVSVASNGNHTGTIIITEGLLSDAALITRVGLRAFSNNTGPQITVNSLTFETEQITELATSDCIDIKTSHECTALLTYSNSKDFDGIEYDTSPGREFNLRVPAVFYQERFPEEEETAELSTADYVRLRNEVKAQKLLDLGYMPFYMHKKMKLILAHDSVEIYDGHETTEVIRQEPYEIQDANKRYPLRRATVWLTEKNYIVRNIL